MKTPEQLKGTIRSMATKKNLRAQEVLQMFLFERLSLIHILTVPAECFYVLGDNTEHSYDSRCWKEPFVERQDVLAVVIIP